MGLHNSEESFEEPHVLAAPRFWRLKQRMRAIHEAYALIHT